MKKLQKIEKMLFHAYLRGSGCELTFAQCKKLLGYLNAKATDEEVRLQEMVIPLTVEKTMYRFAASSWAGVAKRLAEVLKTINDTKHIDLIDGVTQVTVQVIPGLDGDLIDAVLKDYETMAAEVKA